MLADLSTSSMQRRTTTGTIRTRFLRQAKTNNTKNKYIKTTATRPFIHNRQTNRFGNRTDRQQPRQGGRAGTYKPPASPSPSQDGGWPRKCQGNRASTAWKRSRRCLSDISNMGSYMKELRWMFSGVMRATSCSLAIFVVSFGRASTKAFTRSCV